MTDSLNNELTEQLFSITKALKEEMTFSTETSQLTVMQIQALVFLKKNPKTTMGDVANKFGTTLPTATSLINKLVNLGTIERTRDVNDRRVVHISLTEKGENILKEAVQQRNQKVTKMLAYLSKEDKTNLLTILKNLSANIQKSYEK